MLDGSSKHKKAQGVNKNITATNIKYRSKYRHQCHNEYKDVLLGKKCLRHAMNKIQSKDPRTGTYRINKMSLLRFDDKIYIQNNGYDGLAFGYQS